MRIQQSQKAYSSVILNEQWRELNWCKQLLTVNLQNQDQKMFEIGEVLGSKADGEEWVELTEDNVMGADASQRLQRFAILADSRLGDDIIANPKEEQVRLDPKEWIGMYPAKVNLALIVVGDAVVQSSMLNFGKLTTTDKINLVKGQLHDSGIRLQNDPVFGNALPLTRQLSAIEQEFKDSLKELDK